MIFIMKLLLDKLLDT